MHIKSVPSILQKSSIGAPKRLDEGCINQKSSILSATCRLLIALYPIYDTNIV